MKVCHFGRKLKALERREQSNELSVRESFYLFFLFDSPTSLNNSPRHWRLVRTLMREKSICEKNGWKTMIKKEKAPDKSKSGLYKDKVRSESNIRWRISCLKLGWIMGGLGEWGGRRRNEDHNTNIQIQKESFLTLALAQVSKKNNPISVKQGFYSSCT